MFDWPFRTDATLAVQGWGFWLAIIGLIISIIGFAVTLVQLSRTKKATVAVTDEVRRVAFAVSKYDATVETSRAESSLKAVQRFVRNSDWGQATESLEALARALHTVRQLEIPELSSHIESIDRVIAYSNKLCERLDRAGEIGLAHADKNKTLSTMREHDQVITSMRIALERSNISE